MVLQLELILYKIKTFCSDKAIELMQWNNVRKINVNGKWGATSGFTINSITAQSVETPSQTAYDNLWSRRHNKQDAPTMFPWNDGSSFPVLVLFVAQNENKAYSYTVIWHRVVTCCIALLHVGGGIRNFWYPYASIESVYWLPMFVCYPNTSNGFCLVIQWHKKWVSWNPRFQH